MEDLFDAIDAAGVEYRKDYLPELQVIAVRKTPYQLVPACVILRRVASCFDTRVLGIQFH